MTRTRQCPRCDTELEAALAGTIRVDGCARCGGLWFDAQELGQLAREAPWHIGALESQFRAGAAADSGGMGSPRCPLCAVALAEFEYPWAQGIHLDGCPRCHGVWVDDGELAGLATVLARSSAPGGRGPAASSSAGTTASQRARTAASCLLSVPCPDCGERNGTAAAGCWACGRTLREPAPALLCPYCHGPLLPIRDRGRWLEGCARCGGIWLSQDHFSSLLTSNRAAVEALTVQLAPSVPRARLAARPATTLPCPGCHRLMQAHPAGAPSGTQADHCQTCGGVWLEVGGLARIAAFRGENRG
jgi:Zn-finger nucleic acid-binding protein